MTVRQAAGAIGVHRNTSFRWRHRFLAWGKNDRPKHLHGITEADETYFLESEKGARKLSRLARKRGGSATKRGISKEQVCVLVARPDRPNAGLCDRKWPYQQSPTSPMSASGAR